MEDLAAMKLSAVADRGAKKDFVDLYVLASQRLPLRQMLNGYQRKFSATDTVHVLYSLTYFDDADRARMPRMLWDIDWRAIKKAVRRWVHEIAG